MLNPRDTRIVNSLTGKAECRTTLRRCFSQHDWVCSLHGTVLTLYQGRGVAMHDFEALNLSWRWHRKAEATSKLVLALTDMTLRSADCEKYKKVASPSHFLVL